MNPKRRDFLRIMLLGSATVFIPGSKLLAITANSFQTNDEDDGSNNNDFLAAVEITNNAKSEFYKRNYATAESLYLEAISMFPSEIRFYDGLKRVYGADNKLLDIAELYRSGWLINRDKIDFHTRLAHSLLRLCSGNKNEEQQFISKYGHDQLLNFAKRLYKKAIELVPEKQYLQDDFQQAKKKIRYHKQRKEFSKTLTRNNFNTGNNQNQQNKKPKNHYKNLTDETIQNRLTNIDLRNRRHLYFGDEQKQRARTIVYEKKKLSRELFRRARKIKDWGQMEIIANRIYKLDSNDTAITGKIRRIYRKQEKFEELLAFSRQVLEKNSSVWSHIALGKALILYMRKGNGSANHINEAKSIYENLLTNWPDMSEKAKIAVYCGLVHCETINGNYETARETIIGAIGAFQVKKSHIINTLLIGYAKSYVKQGDLLKAEKVLTKLLNFHEQDIELQEEEVLNNAISGMVKTTSKSNLPAFYYLANIYRKKGKTDYETLVYQKILAINPADTFAKSKLQNQN